MAPAGAKQGVKAMVRVRPFSKSEREQGAPGDSCVEMQGSTTTVLDPGRDYCEKASFEFDACFWSIPAAQYPSPQPFSTQEAVYQSAGLPVLSDALDGYNSCLLAYGQTGSGKTHTMMGTDDDPGVIPRIVSHLFERIAEAECASSVRYKVELSFMEIYNEKVRDLLLLPTTTKAAQYASRWEKKPDGADHKDMKVRQHPLSGPFVEGLTRVVVSSAAGSLEYLRQGMQERTVGATAMNEQSSRSHAILQLALTRNEMAAKGEGRGKVTSTMRLSKMSLVDLAGSERVAKTRAEGKRLAEAANINKSLSTLRMVIDTLIDNKKKEKQRLPPYRESLLTWILADSFGGNSCLSLLATISPHPANLDETMSTLRYAHKAKGIVNKARVNEDASARLIRELNERVKVLEMQLKTRRVTSTASELQQIEEQALMGRRAVEELQSREAELQVALDEKSELAAKLAADREKLQSQKQDLRKEKSMWRERAGRAEELLMLNAKVASCGGGAPDLAPLTVALHAFLLSQPAAPTPLDTVYCAADALSKAIQGYMDRQGPLSDDELDERGEVELLGALAQSDPYGFTSILVDSEVYMAEESAKPPSTTLSSVDTELGKRRYDTTGKNGGLVVAYLSHSMVEMERTVRVATAEAVLTAVTARKREVPLVDVETLRGVLAQLGRLDGAVREVAPGVPEIRFSIPLENRGDETAPITVSGYTFQLGDLLKQCKAATVVVNDNVLPPDFYAALSEYTARPGYFFHFAPHSYTPLTQCSTIPEFSDWIAQVRKCPTDWGFYGDGAAATLRQSLCELSTNVAVAMPCLLLGSAAQHSFKLVVGATPDFRHEVECAKYFRSGIGKWTGFARGGEAALRDRFRGMFRVVLSGCKGAKYVVLGAHGVTNAFLAGLGDIERRKVRVCALRTQYELLCDVEWGFDAVYVCAGGDVEYAVLARRVLNRGLAPRGAPYSSHSIGGRQLPCHVIIDTQSTELDTLQALVQTAKPCALISDGGYAAVIHGLYGGAWETKKEADFSPSEALAAKSTAFVARCDVNTHLYGNARRCVASDIPIVRTSTAGTGEGEEVLPVTTDGLGDPSDGAQHSILVTEGSQERLPQKEYVSSLRRRLKELQQQSEEIGKACEAEEVEKEERRRKSEEAVGGTAESEQSPLSLPAPMESRNSELPPERLHGEEALLACGSCGRRFRAAVLQKHSAVCHRINAKRKAFNMRKQRQEGLDIPVKPPTPPPSRPRPTWREQREQFLSAIRVTAR